LYNKKCTIHIDDAFSALSQVRQSRLLIFYILFII